LEREGKMASMNSILKGPPVETPGLKQLKDKKENDPTTPKFGLPPSLGDVIVKQKPSKRRKHVFFDIMIEGEKDRGGRIGKVFDSI
jgi:hypothetical protein